ncbi:reverse transcriptase domain-containing protein [Tanacetum coccineum]
MGKANMGLMFQLMLTRNARVWFDKLPKESVDSYEDLRATFRENYCQQTKHIKDPVEIHHIKQRDGESTEDFMERYKEEVLDVEGAPECMKISEFMHGITHPELIKRWPHSVWPKEITMPWKQPERGNKPSFKKGFKNKHMSDRKPNRFSLLTKTLKEILALEKGKFKAPPPMVTPTEKRDPNKYFEFHADTGHNTDECMQLRKQIDEMIKAGKTTSHPDDPTMGKSSQAKGYPEFLPGDKQQYLSTTGGTITLRSSKIIPMECAMIYGPSTRPPEAGKILEEKQRVDIHPE